MTFFVGLLSFENQEPGNPHVPVKRQLLLRKGSEAKRCEGLSPRHEESIAPLILSKRRLLDLVLC